MNPTPGPAAIRFWHACNVARFHFKKFPESFQSWCHRRVSDACVAARSGARLEDGFAQLLAGDGLIRNRDGYVILPLNDLDELRLMEEAEQTYLRLPTLFKDKNL